ncbi:hypothetical protein HYT02_02070 [Candidatus Gottesmanbacteria bacterium]|nr:hypothetical protein [Candidatus Gottesmanbacteria bacterium]
MARRSETFILKEFLVGLIVLLFFLFIFLFIARKFTASNSYKKLFPTKIQNVFVATQDNCGELGFGFIAKSTNSNFTRVVTRPGYQQEDHPFVLSVAPSGQNSFIIETVSTTNEVPQEKINAQCSSDSINIKPPNLLISSLLNVFPQDYSASQYELTEPKVLIITRQSRIEGAPWENSFTIRGVMNGSCFSTKAQGLSALTKSDNLTITTNWVATTSANPSNDKSLTDCLTNEQYGQSVKVEVEEMYKISETDGIIQYDISAKGIVGQASLLPNGYIQASYSNIPSQEPTGEPTLQPSLTPAQ